MKKYIVGAVAMMLVSGAASAQNLVKNGNFEQTSLTSSSQFVNEVNNWTNAATGGYTGYGYNFLVTPNSADASGFRSFGPNTDYIYGPKGTGRGPVYGNNSNFADNGFTGVSPTGGNFILADGDTNFHGAISQIIDNLTVGQTYSLSFDWAGASWFTTPGQTTQRFDVTFGDVLKSTETIQTAPKGFSGWRKASLEFTATKTSQTLSFLAQGTPNGLPPSLLLDNVTLGAVPEPATWMTMILGFGVVGGAMRRRKSGTTVRTQLV